MSSPAPLRPSRPANPLREQLDELDSLLERMLALPVNPADEDDHDPAGRPEEPQLRVLVSPEEEAPAPPARLEVEVPPPAAAEAPPAPPPPAAATELVPRPRVALPLAEQGASGRAVVARAADTQWPRLRVSRPEPEAFWWRPLVWVNRLFDRGASRLGPAGRWLRGRTGRAVLGGAGLLLLAAALGVVLLDWIGWTR